MRSERGCEGGNCQFKGLENSRRLERRLPFVVVAEGGSQGPGQGSKPGLVRYKGAFGSCPEAIEAIEGH